MIFKDNRVKWYIKKGAICVLILLMLAVVGYGVILIDFYSVEAFMVESTPSIDGQITIMSSNVRNHNLSDTGDTSWYVRAELQLEQIAEVAPDIICFQEVKCTQEYYFNEKLQGYDSVITYRDSSITAEAVPIYYRADKFNLIETGSFWFSETPAVSSVSWGSSFPRICTYVVLEEKATGSVFAVFNSHLEHKSEEARLNSVQMVIEKIAELGDIPAIFMGDLNGSETSSVYESATNYFVDAKYIASETMSCPSFNGFGTVEADDMEWLLDYCLLTESDFIALSYSILNTTANGIYRSDHYPLVCTLQFA